MRRNDADLSDVICRFHAVEDAPPVLAICWGNIHRAGRNRQNKVHLPIVMSQRLRARQREAEITVRLSELKATHELIPRSGDNVLALGKRANHPLSARETQQQWTHMHDHARPSFFRFQLSFFKLTEFVALKLRPACA